MPFPLTSPSRSPSPTLVHFVNRASDLAYAMARWADVDDPALFEGRGR